MAKLLYLVHRMPYPPNKGDKVRSYHLLQHLRREHQVFVGTFVDDPEDHAHVPTLRSLCADAYVATLDPRRARLASLAGLATGQALTLRYYHDAGLKRWVRETVERERIDAVVVYSSSMAQYAEDVPQLPCLIDFVDVDSAKWATYAERRPWPLSWVYRREGRKLLAYERSVAGTARRSFFSTPAEADLFVSLAPECAAGVEPVCNGVDAEFFSPADGRPTPFAAGELPIVFTGAMDYWPNVDAVVWFAREALPALRQRHPGARFYIVGRSPAPAVRALAADDVVVTGTVPDVRPYLQHAAVVVAPLRVARGIQNKILEAMSMGRPVVAATGCVSVLSARPGAEIVTAEAAGDYVEAVDALLRDSARSAAVGEAGRQRVLHDYAWDAHLSAVDRHLLAAEEAPVAA